jgi:hypothetical protein
MTPKEFEQRLLELLDEVSRAHDLGDLSSDLGDDIQSVSSYENVGMMTHDCGVVVRTIDGTEFRVSIHEARW